LTSIADWRSVEVTKSPCPQTSFSLHITFEQELSDRLEVGVPILVLGTHFRIGSAVVIERFAKIVTSTSAKNKEFVLSKLARPIPNAMVLPDSQT
jgi:hypothetical protein